MVNKSVLRKLSDSELEKYIKEGNRFVPEAVSIAFELLKERGRVFTEEEKTAVQELIQSKKNAEEAKLTEEKELWKDHITEDPTAIKLYSRMTVFISSVLLGTIPGAILLCLNLIKLKKYFPALLTLIFGFLFFFLQEYVFQSHFDFSTTSRSSPEMGIIVIGTLSLVGIWVATIPKKLPYQAESYIFPVILCIGTAVLMSYYYRDWFSIYPLLKILRLFR